MATRRHSRTTRVRSVTAGSWIALVAATMLGDAADALRAEVRADDFTGAGRYRLVVQSYDSHDGHVPGRNARPVGSVQRAVTADELRNGVHVSLLEMREAADSGQLSAPMVLAWIEVGGPDLEFDGRVARPGPGSVYGMAKRGPAGGVLQISLNRKLLA
jgi:hypothetical protein